MMILALLLLCGLSLYLNRDWFAKDHVHIYHRSFPPRPGMIRRKSSQDPMAAVNPVVFGFDRGSFKLTSIKVVPVSAIETNKYPEPIWHLVSESNSIPVKDFLYGMRIAGMHPAVPGATADPLEPNVKYRLLIEAGAFKAVHDFTPIARTP
jgi:hypothetical protein